MAGRARTSNPERPAMIPEGEVRTAGPGPGDAGAASLNAQQELAEMETEAPPVVGWSPRLLLARASWRAW